MLGLGALLTWSNLARRSEATLRMPDGSVFVVQKATYGTNHVYRYGKLIPRLLLPMLSTRQKQKWGAFDYIRSNDSACLVIWGHWSGLKKNDYPPSVISFVDSNGVESEPVFGLSLPDPKSDEAHISWMVSNYPRREATLRLKMYQYDTQARLASRGEIKLQNPSPKSLPRWIPRKGSVAHSAQGVEFRLLSLAADGVPVPGLHPRRPDLLPGYTAVYQVQQDQRPVPEWEALETEISDATGNWFVPRRKSLSRLGDFCFSHFTGTLWPDEKAWKLKTTFIKRTNFAANEVLTVSNVPVSEVSGRAGQTNTFTVPGQTNVLLSIQQFQPYPPLGNFPGQNGRVELTLADGNKRRWVTLQKVSDQDGRLIPFSPEPVVSTNWPTGLRIPPGSRVLNFEFAMQQPITLEFLTGLQDKPGSGAARH